MFSKQILDIKFGITSSKTMLSWSHGEVRNGNSFDDDGKTIMDGLFCSKILDRRIQPNVYTKTPTLTQSFGCMVCHVYLGGNKTKLRSRFGHISLTPSMVHTLFYKTMPNVLILLLDLVVRIDQDLVRCKPHVIRQCGTEDLQK